MTTARPKPKVGSKNRYGFDAVKFKPIAECSTAPVAGMIGLPPSAVQRLYSPQAGFSRAHSRFPEASMSWGRRARGYAGALGP
jgi:hypothetical protein